MTTSNSAAPIPAQPISKSSTRAEIVDFIVQQQGVELSGNLGNKLTDALGTGINFKLHQLLNYVFEQLDVGATKNEQV